MVKVSSAKNNIDQDILLKLSGISHSFGTNKVLEEISLGFRAGKVHALLGENGAGKSTLMNIIAGIIIPDSGGMILDGKMYQPKTPLEARLSGVSMVHQELSLAPHLTIVENIALGAEPKRSIFLNKKAMREAAIEALSLIGIENLDINQRVSHLPIYTRQIVEIARALHTKCKVLILDEPTSSLPSQDIDKLFHAIDTIRKNGSCIIYISHFLDQIRQISDHYSVLRGGKLSGDGVISDKSNSDLITLMAGSDSGEYYHKGNHQPGELLLEVNQLSIDGTLGDCNLKLHRGEVLGIAGLIGSGRSELLRSIFGLDKITTGKVIKIGLMEPHTPSHSWQNGIGFISEDRSGEGIARNMSILDNIYLPLSRSDKLFSIRDLKSEQLNTEELIRKLNIRSRNGNQKVGYLSGGNQQKVALARLLNLDVDLLLLDEPTKGIDVSSKSEIYSLIDYLVRQASPKKCVLIVSSYIPELLGVCDKIAVMRSGKLGPARPVSELSENLILQESFGVNSAA